MTRTTRAELDALAGMIRKATGDASYEINQAYGQPRLERLGGSVDVSPRLPAGEMGRWLRAFIAGIDVGRNRRDALTIRCRECDAACVGLIEFENHMRAEHRTVVQVTREPDGFTAIIKRGDAA